MQQAGRDLCSAIGSGDTQTVARMLAQIPNLIHERIVGDWTPLHFAASKGQDAIVAQLLAASPDVVHAVDNSNRTALVVSSQAGEGHKKVAEMLLAASPSLIDAVDKDGWTVLHHACHARDASLALMFLDFKPDLAFALENQGTTPLPFAVHGVRDAEVLTRLLELNPSAVRPALLALAFYSDNEIAIELLQSRFEFGDISNALVVAEKSVERYRPVVESQCESLVVLLNQDVVGIVFEYLGFEQSWVKRKKIKK